MKTSNKKIVKFNEVLTSSTLTFANLNEAYIDENEDVSNISFVKQDNEYFLTVKPNVDILPSGKYQILFDEFKGPYLQEKEITQDNIIDTKESYSVDVVEDINKFVDRKDVYKKYGITHKRGILLYGIPGTGKTVTVNKVAEHIISNNGIVLYADSIYSLRSILSVLRKKYPSRIILVIIEEFEEFLYNNSERQVLNLLDGIDSYESIVYLATTNYISQIPDRIKRRPSRFDMVIEVAPPTDLSRELFLRSKLIGDENVDIDKWVRDTKGMTFSHLKELFISVVVMGNDYDSSLNRIKGMMIQDTSQYNEY